jgi:hypothetical protein
MNQFNRGIPAAGGHQGTGGVCANVRRQRGRSRRAALPKSVLLEVGLGEDADHAVFGCGAAIDRQRETRTVHERVAEAITETEVAAQAGLALGPH